MQDLERYLLSVSERNPYPTLKKPPLDRLFGNKPLNISLQVTTTIDESHNHLIVKGDIVGDITSTFKVSLLIGKHVKHLPYEKNASMYVSKFICDEKVNYNIVKNS